MMERIARAQRRAARALQPRRRQRRPRLRRRLDGVRRARPPGRRGRAASRRTSGRSTCPGGRGPGPRRRAGDRRACARRSCSRCPTTPRKCGFRSAVLGLSGGIDSAVTAALAVEALGADRVLGVAMPGPVLLGGKRARRAGRSPSASASACAEIPIGPVLDAYRATLGPAGRHGRAVADRGEPPGAHPRRDPHGALEPRSGTSCSRPATSPRSRSATARSTATWRAATRSSPTCRRRWSTRSPRSSTATRERIPRASIEKPPSAELRPNQKDSDSLPPYDELDPLIEALVDLALPDRARRRGAPASRSRSRGEIADRIDRNEYKRRQMPPGPEGHGARLRRGPPLPDRAEVPWLSRPRSTPGRRSRAPPTTCCAGASGRCRPGCACSTSAPRAGTSGARCATAARSSPASSRTRRSRPRRARATTTGARPTRSRPGTWNEPFDAVVCADVLEHLPRPEALLEPIRGWLRPGGTLLVSLPERRQRHRPRRRCSPAASPTPTAASSTARTCASTRARTAAELLDARRASASARGRPRPRCPTSSRLPACSAEPPGAARCGPSPAARRASGRRSSATSS